MNVSFRICVWLRVAVAVVAMSWGSGADPAVAQAPIFTLDALSIGACRVVVRIGNPRGGDNTPGMAPGCSGA
jgi:hypothetical protein